MLTRSRTVPRKDPFQRGMLRKALEKGKVEIVAQGKNCFIIQDGFPKALFHFLVIPKDFSLDYLRNTNFQILKEMKHFAENFALERIPLSCSIGFHSVPSQDILHLHIISNDLLCLKHLSLQNFLGLSFPEATFQKENVENVPEPLARKLIHASGLQKKPLKVAAMQLVSFAHPDYFLDIDRILSGQVKVPNEEEERELYLQLLHAVTNF